MTNPIVGAVSEIWRYPIKSMLGEQLHTVDVTPQGLQGDRTLALIDQETGKVASAKRPRLWARLFDYAAAYLRPAEGEESLPLIRIDRPDAAPRTTADASLADELSAELGRTVRLATLSANDVTSEGYWPDFDWLDRPDEVFEFTLPQGTFFDGMQILIVTTAALKTMAATAPESRFDVARFRPNFVIETPVGGEGFVEEEWIGRTLKLGQAQLKIERPCPRCVMTTMSQGDLPKDPQVLRTAVQRNQGNVGVYATVITPGEVQRADVAELMS